MSADRFTRPSPSSCSLRNCFAASAQAQHLLGRCLVCKYEQLLSPQGNILFSVQPSRSAVLPCTLVLRNGDLQPPYAHSCIPVKAFHLTLMLVRLLRVAPQHVAPDAARLLRVHCVDLSNVCLPECCRPTGSAPSRRNVMWPSRRSVSRRRLRRSCAFVCSSASAAPAASARRWDPAAALALQPREFVDDRDASRSGCCAEFWMPPRHSLRRLSARPETCVASCRCADQ